jgi:hypothetical protein
MTKYLVILVSGILSANTLQAQVSPMRAAHEPFELPQAVRAKLAEQHPGRRPAATTARKAGKTTFYEWEAGPGQWTTKPRVSTTTYNSNGQPTQRIESDSVTQRPNQRSTYSYTATGKLATELQEYWDGSAWQPSNRYSTTYNDQQYATEYLTQSWQDGLWGNIARVVVEYDSHNHYTVSRIQNWADDAWVTANGMRATVSYSAAGAVLEEAEEVWNPVSASFEKHSRNLYTYPSAASLLYSARVLELWEPSSNFYYAGVRINHVVWDSQQRQTYSETEIQDSPGWQPYSRTTTTYQANGGRQELWERLEANTNTWINQRRQTESYDNFGNSLGATDEQWLNNAWALSGGSRYLLRYNAGNEVLSSVFQIYDGVAKSYINGSKFTYGDLQDVTLATTAALSGRTQLYPNPTSGALTMELAGLTSPALVKTEIVNTLGQVVQSQNLRPEQGQLRSALDLSGLQAGVYSVRLHTPAGLVVKKVVRQ